MSLVSKPWWQKVLLVALLLLMLGSVSSHGATGSAAPSVPGTRSDAYTQGASVNAFQALTLTANTLDAKLKEMLHSPGLMNIGLSLLVFFGLANAIYLLLKGYVGGNGINGVIADFISLAILAGVVTIFLDRDVGGAIKDSLDVVAGTITGLGGGANASLASLVQDAALDTFDTLGNLWSIGSTVKLGWLPSSWVNALFSFLLKLAAIGLASLFILAAVGMYVGTLVTSQVVVTIGLILAPLFVPFLLFSPGAFLFDGWLRFTIGAAMMKVIGALMVKITGIIMSVMAGVSTKTVASSAANALGVDIVLYASMILLAGLCFYLMLQVPSIATGLLSGSGGAGGFRGWSEIANRSMTARFGNTYAAPAAKAALVGGKATLDAARDTTRVGLARRAGRVDTMRAHDNFAPRINSRSMAKWSDAEKHAYQRAQARVNMGRLKEWRKEDRATRKPKSPWYRTTDLATGQVLGKRAFGSTAGESRVSPSWGTEFYEIAHPGPAVEPPAGGPPQVPPVMIRKPSGS